MLTLFLLATLFPLDAGLCEFTHTCPDGEEIMCSKAIPEGGYCHAYRSGNTVICEVYDENNQWVRYPDTRTCWSEPIMPPQPTIDQPPCGIEPY